MTKKNLFHILLLLTSLVSCEKTSNQFENTNEDPYAYIQRSCGYEEITDQDLIVKNKGQAEKIKHLEKQTEILTGQFNKSNNKDLPVIKVPIIFHIVRSGDMPKISKEIIQSQINALNDAYNPKKLDKSNIPDEFKDLMANPKIEFFTHKIINKESNIINWHKTEELIKNPKEGSKIIEPKKYLNVYVCNTIYGTNSDNPILGYAWNPYKTRDSNDGVVVTYKAFGRHNFKNDYTQGKTLVHEIGHYLNLSHIWGPNDKKSGATYCQLGDGVDDTPNASNPNYDCPSYPLIKDIVCKISGKEEVYQTSLMFMNYMDYVNDECMHMFTFGQVERMRATFKPGGGRDRLIK
ncbi:M43 family zinc metalloprotease [Tenacibaculum sp. C7A-26P2]|uniref:M43 family zinc metalloprotease n=1 Tax=Tenacibaculum sp. C7A-26P2 TaxID=3447504 RepID=UPI003F833104